MLEDIFLFIKWILCSVVDVDKSGKKPYISEMDREFLGSLSRERLLEVMMFNIRNIWRVDGLYFQGIEKRFGTEVATEIDAETWATMGILEAKALKSMLGIGGGASIEDLMHALRHTSWVLDHLEKEVKVEGGRGVVRIINCRTQVARLNKGLPEFPCKRVRHGYLINFAREMNPKIRCICSRCPPDPHPGEVWCEWHFILE